MTNNLPEFDGFVVLDKIRFLPKCSGIYFVISQDEVFYVGQSGNIRARFTSHHKKKDFLELESPRIYWISVPKYNLDKVEQECIVQFSPCMNGYRLPQPHPDKGGAIEGKLYTSQELQEYLDVSKQRVSYIAKKEEWGSPAHGVYWAEDVEPYLMGRNIDPATLPVCTWNFPEGATWAEREAALEEINQD